MAKSDVIGSGKRARSKSNEFDALSYNDLAAEYYDAVRHPTCANFREASIRAINSLSGSGAFFHTILDLGAGKSILPELNVTYKRAVLVDSSLSMLSYSIDFANSIPDVSVLVADGGIFLFRHKVSTWF